MQHLAVKATVTETDAGEFTAIAAAYSVDRQGERLVPGAFRETIADWRDSGKAIPLHWNHEAGAESVVGSVTTMRERSDGLFVEGTLDLEDSRLAREAWRSLKRNRIGLSFGYVVLDAHDGSDGVRELTALDLYEVSLTPAPANRDTRVLSTKNVSTEAKRYVDPKTGRRMNVAELHAHTKAMSKRMQPIKVRSFES